MKQQHDAHTHGLWQFQSEIAFEHEPGRQVHDIFTFAYDGVCVTLRLLTLDEGRWKSADDFYKLQAKWEGSTLYYRPPFGPWTELASFEDGRFVNVGNGRKRIFGKITDDQVVPWNAAILTPGRAPHDYRRQPDGSLKDGP
jgi:hypothetical protein